jgi:hypothetical protein
MIEIWNNQYGDTEWRLAKISLIILWFLNIKRILLGYNSAPIQQGIFTWYNFEFIDNPIWRYLILLISFILTLMYLFEKRMTISTLGLFVISVFSFSLEESNGILSRASLLSFIFFAQYLAYFIHIYYPNLDYKQLRFTFSIQAVVASYVLSAISKLTASGIEWVSNSKYLSLQILKSYHYKYVNYAEHNILKEGIEFATYVQDNQNIITTLLTISLILELFAWISLGSKKRAIIYGILLLFMHIGIKLTMDIVLVAIIGPMLIFMVNPLFIIWTVILKPFYNSIQDYYIQTK